MTTTSDAIDIQGSWISAARVVEFLQRHGWESRGGREGIYTRFRAPAGSDEQKSVVIPLNPHLGDYRFLLEDALEGVAIATGMGAGRLLADLDIGAGDRIKFRKEVMTPHGSIPWRAGEALVSSSTKILESAAKAERERSRYFGNKHWTTAKAYLDGVRMGQTEVGSYVVTALSPIEALPGVDVPLPGFGDPLSGRDVTRTLASGLGAARNAIDESLQYKTITPFVEAVNLGLSYEMARGIMGIVNNSDGADVSVEWQASGDTASEILVVEFRPSDIRPLERAVNRLGQTAAPENVTVLGMVTLLSRPSPGSPGVVRLDILEGSQAKKLRVRMPEELYDLAIRGHREGMAMRLSGRQEREGQLYWLYDPYDIDLVDPPLLPDPPSDDPYEDDELRLPPSTGSLD